jgi:glycosyltransferase involved in cell wall biosynthesis
MQALVSIITPNYNGARFLSETIETVLGQTYPHWEMIIVDDGSSDESVQIIEQYQRHDARIRLIRLPKRSGGPARPRNVGLDHAQGEYVAFLDNDDLWHPQKLALQLACMQQHGVALSSCAMVRFERSSELVQAMATHLNVSDVCVRRITHRMLLRRHFTPHVVAERRLFEAIRFNEDPRYVAIEDYECWLRLHQYCVPYSIKLRPPLWFYRQIPSSISHAKLPMLRKNVVMYTEYELHGKRLGWRGYWYVGMYVVRSLLNRLAMRWNIPALNIVDF